MKIKPKSPTSKQFMGEDNKSHVVLQQPEPICMITMTASKKNSSKAFPKYISVKVQRGHYTHSLHITNISVPAKKNQNTTRMITALSSPKLRYLTSSSR
jgi:hypothetical protein